MTLPNHDHIENAINRIEGKVKHGKFKHLKKQLKYTVLKDFHKDIPNPKRDSICAKARKEAHKPVADMKRNVSNQVRDDFGM